MALTCISSMATRNLLNALAAEYLASSASRVDIESVGGVEAAKRVLNGEPFDIVILASDALPPLADAGRIDRASLVEVVRSSLAVAVKAGAPAPDVGSEAGLRDAVRCAHSVGYSTGPAVRMCCDYSTAGAWPTGKPKCAGHGSCRRSQERRSAHWSQAVRLISASSSSVN